MLMYSSIQLVIYYILASWFQALSSSPGFQQSMISLTPWYYSSHHVIFPASDRKLFPCEIQLELVNNDHAEKRNSKSKAN